MRRAHVAFSLALAAMLLCGASAWAAEKVGRTSFEVPAGWSLVTSYENKLIFAGGAYTMPMFHALYQLPGKGDTPRALLLVSSTDGGFSGNVDWISEVCPDPRPQFFTNDFGGRPLTRKRECLVVNSFFAPAKFFSADSQAVKGLEDKGLKLFRAGLSLRSVVGVRGGTLLRVNLMTQPGFTGLESAPQAEDLHEVPPALVAWGEALHQAVSNSAYSVGGDMQLPPISFSR